MFRGIAGQHEGGISRSLGPLPLVHRRRRSRLGLVKMKGMWAVKTRGWVFVKGKISAMLDALVFEVYRWSRQTRI